MGLNKHVDFSTAKLLKEKEYKDKNMLGTVRLSEPEYYDPNGIIHNIKDAFEEKDYKIEDCYNAPTIAEVVMWLYEKHGIWIAVNRVVIGSDEWDYSYIISYLPKEYEFEKRRSKHLVEIQSFKEGVGSYHGAWYTPTEAYEAAIKYTLNNLI